MPSRRLELAFILSGQPFAWQCSLCGRLFVRLGSEVAHSELEQIQCEFRQHLCSPVAKVLTIEEISEFDKRAVPSIVSVKDR